MDEKAATEKGLHRLAQNFRVAWSVAGFLALLVLISWGLVAWMWSRAMQPSNAVQRVLPQRATAQAGACAPLALAQTPTSILAETPTTPTAAPAAKAPSAAAGDQPSLSADFAARLNQLVSTGSPFQLDLFVMSKCPYGNIAEVVLLPWLQNHPGAADFHLWYIASGDLTNGFQSLHGPTEVMEDLRQEAILTNYPAKLNDYLACRNANYSDDSGWIDCASQVGLDNNELDSLAQTPENANALAQNVQH